MSTTRDTFFFNVIEVECSPKFSPYYEVAKKLSARSWHSSGKGLVSLDLLALDMAYDVASQKVNYQIMSDLSIQDIDHQDFRHEGLVGYSGSPTMIKNIRTLDRYEMSELGKLFIEKLKSRREFLAAHEDK